MTPGPAKRESAEARKGPPPPREMADSYERMAMDKLASAEGESAVAGAMLEADVDSDESGRIAAKAKALREEASIAAQISTSIRLGLLIEDRVELAIARGPEHPHQPGDEL